MSLAFDKGDVVFGCFPGCDDTTLSNHYSVVMAVSEGLALLVYTTSAKGQNSRAESPAAGWFSDEDCNLAGWTKSCRYDASIAALVPVSRLVRKGRISRRTAAAIEGKLMRASSNPRETGFTLRRFNPEHAEVLV